MYYFLYLYICCLGLVYFGIVFDVVEILCKYCWFGNLCELSNLMEYLVNVVFLGEVIDSMLLLLNLLNNGIME